MKFLHLLFIAYAKRDMATGNRLVGIGISYLEQRTITNIKRPEYTCLAESDFVVQGCECLFIEVLAVLTLLV